MARRRNEIFAHNNKYEGNIFKKFGRWFGKLETWKKTVIIAVLVVLVVAIGVVSYVSAKLDLMDRVKVDETKLSCVDVDGYINILLLGVDSRDMDNINGAGADAIMILSIKEETGEVKLMSVYRDTYLKFGDTDTYGKITDANRYGGPEMMMSSLNQAMDLNINKFAVVNFKAVADLVDAVGGIEVDVQEVEIPQLNKYTVQTANNIGKKDYKLVEKAGVQTIEGVQAVSYGRIRKGVGDDFKRTERMRIVLSKIFDKVKTMNPAQINKILDLILPQAQTNLSNSDILGLAMRVMDFNISGGAGWPYNITGGMMNGISYVFPDDLTANTVKLHQEMFGRDDYTPSDVVVAISNTIQSNINSSVTNQKPIEPEVSGNQDIGKDTGKDKDKDKGKPDDGKDKPDTGTDKPSDGNNGGTDTPKPNPSPEPEPTPTPEPEPIPEPEPTPTPPADESGNAV